MFVNLFNYCVRVLLLLTVFSAALSFGLPREAERELELYCAFFIHDTDLPSKSIAELIKEGAKGDFVIIVNGISADFATLAVIDFKRMADALEDKKRSIALLESNEVSFLCDYPEYRKKLAHKLVKESENFKKLLDTLTQRHKEFGGLVKKAKSLSKDQEDTVYFVHWLVHGLLVAPNEMIMAVSNYLREQEIIFKISDISCTLDDLVEYMNKLWQEREEEINRLIQICMTEQDLGNIQKSVFELALNDLNNVECYKQLAQEFCTKSTLLQPHKEHLDELEELLKKNKRR